MILDKNRLSKRYCQVLVRVKLLYLWERRVNYIVSMMLILVALNVSAEEIFPAGCKPLVLHEELVKLSTEVPSLVMIHNLSTMDLWITHPLSEINGHEKWSSRLQSGNWSALALDKKSFDLSCIESRPGHEQQVPCAGLLSACQWTPVPTPKSEPGTFWAGEDLSLSALTAHVGSRGLVLPATN